MGKIWMPGGGSGADLEVITAESGDVLAGKMIVDKDGNSLPGTMPNRGAVNQSLGINGTCFIPEGYHNGAGKVTQNIPVQNPNVPNTGDRVYATNMSNWAGTINLAVRSGHYLNGVNWIQQDIPNYQAANIKKGVNIGGIVGTWEGYVPGALDLYKRGAWGGISSGNLALSWYGGNGYGTGYLRYDISQIAIVSPGMIHVNMLTKIPFEVTRYSYFNVTYSSPQSSLNTYRPYLQITCGTSYDNNPDAGGMATGQWRVLNKLADTGDVNFPKGSSEVNIEKTVSMDIRNINTTVYFVLEFMHPRSGDVYHIKEIWFS